MKWYMQMYGGLTMKPHYAWANSASVRQLETPAPKRKRQDDDQPKVKTCEQYVNKDGKTCYHGNKNLRRTENLNLNWPMQVGFYFLESDWLLTLYFLDVPEILPKHCQSFPPSKGVSCEIWLQAGRHVPFNDKQPHGKSAFSQ